MIRRRALIGAALVGMALPLQMAYSASSNNTEFRSPNSPQAYAAQVLAGLSTVLALAPWIEAKAFDPRLAPPPNEPWLPTIIPNITSKLPSPRIDDVPVGLMANPWISTRGMGFLVGVRY